MKNKLRDAYNEIIEVLEKYEDIIFFNIKKFEEESKVHLFWYKLKSKYNLDIKSEKIKSLAYNKLKDSACISWWGDKDCKMSIASSDNGEQPLNELLLKFSFPTGAYILGDHYPEEIFNKFFNKLKNYNPKYIDSINHCVYYNMNNASTIFNNYDNILKEYQEASTIEYKKKKFEKLEKELDKLKEELE